MRALILSLLWLLWPAQPVLAGALERAMLGKATVVDLSHVVGEPAHAPAAQELPRQESEEGEHPRPSPRAPLAGELGTHLDVPAAGLNDKPTVAHITPRQLLVQAVVVNIAALVAERGEYRATVGDLQAWERRNGRIPKQAMVLLHTGWSRRWSDPARYLNLDPQGVAKVPGFSAAALAFLVNDRDVRGVGLDAFTPEGSLATGSSDGRALLLKGRFQIENLTNLDRLPPKGVKLVIMPLRVEGGSAPARVIAILP